MTEDSDVFKRGYLEGERLYWIVLDKLPKEEREAALFDFVEGIQEAMLDSLEGE